MKMLYLLLALAGLTLLGLVLTLIGAIKALTLRRACSKRLGVRRKQKGALKGAMRAPEFAARSRSVKWLLWSGLGLISSVLIFSASFLLATLVWAAGRGN